MTQSDAQANVWVLQLTKVEMNMLLLVFKLSLKSQTEVFPVSDAVSEEYVSECVCYLCWSSAKIVDLMIMYRTGWQEATCVIFADTSEIPLWGVFWAGIP